MSATRARLLLVLLGAALVAFLATRRRLDVVEVRGQSMAPTLLPGDRLVLARLRRTARPGEIVVADDPRDPSRELIKRVATIAPRGVDLRGDNDAASTDGRTFGPLAPRAAQWRVALRYWPLERIGRPGRAPIPARAPADRD